MKKRLLAIVISLVMVLSLVPQVTFAAAGDTPVHSKSIKDNGDGTFTISLDVVGDAEKKPNNINVIVIMDTSGSMTTQRMNAAKNAVNSLATALYAYNTANEPNTVQMALVRFATSSSVARTPTSNSTQFTNSVNGLPNQGNGGTNWEAALQTANNDVSFGDDDQTFVIFVSDGNPTFRTTQNGWNDWSQQYQQYGNGQETTENIRRCYTTAVDDAQALATKVTPANFFTIGAFGNVDRMEQLTDDAGSNSSTNYYSAQNTAALNQAISDILAKIEMAGIASVDVADGTTNQVTTSSGEVAELLEVDTSSFKYYRTGGDYGTMAPWADAPKATFENGAVNWDLSSEGILENGVRYTVTFDCYPSQEAYDIIAQLKNGDILYSDLDSEIQKYIADNGNGSYSVRTNTNAYISYDDTRDDAGVQTSGYINPPPVATDASTLTVTKEWEGGEPDVDALTMTVLMDGEPFHETELSKTNGWSSSSYISIGIIKDGKVLPGSEGHDFTFAELGDEQYHWELVSPVVRPMRIGENVVMLVKEDADHPVPSSATTYTIDGATYYVDSTAAGLTATNHRRSNLNLTKVVKNEAAPADAEFEFKLTVNNSKAPATAPSAEDDPEHESDYWVWLSIRDENGQGVTGLAMTGVTEDSGGYYYAPNGTTFTLKIKEGWSLRFLNLPSGTTYTFEESSLPDGFTFEEAELTQGEDSTFKAGQTTTGTIENTKTSYAVQYTNDYAVTNFAITKVWVDNNDQDGRRPTAEEFADYLQLQAKSGDGTFANYPSDPDADPIVPEITVDDEDPNKYIISYTDLPAYLDNAAATYQVIENPVPSYYNVSGTPAADGGKIVNERQVGSLTISKEVDSEFTPDKTKEFTFTITTDPSIKGTFEATKNDEATTVEFTNGSATVTLKDGESITIEGLATNVKYTITETEVAGMTTTINGTTEGRVFVVESLTEEGAEAEFTNTRETGDLEVNKTVESDLAADANVEFEFTVRLGDTSISGTFGDMTFTGGVATFKLKGGEKKTATGLPAAVTYTVTEATATGFTTESTGATGTISAAKSTAAFTNTRETGDLEVNKTVDSDLAADADVEFDFTVTLGDTSISGTFGDMTFTDGVATFKLKGGEKKTATGLPTTVTYTVTEATATGFTTESTGATGAISTTKSTAAFTNTRETGDLEVNKTVDSDLAADADVEFEFTVTLGDTSISGTFGDMTFTDGVATFKLKGGEKKTATGLPTTVTYTVTEATATGFTTESTGATGTISTTKSTAAFTNTRVQGGLEVSKTVDSDLAADADVEFDFTVTLGDTTISGTFGDMTFTDGVATFKLKGGEKKTATGLPTTVTYTVTEATATGFTTESTGTTGTISAEEVAKAAFTNTRETGDLEVTKTVKSDLAADADAEFEFTVTLGDTTISGTFGDMTFTDGVATFKLKGGEKKTATGLPTTVTYTVTEATATGFTTESTGVTGAISTTKSTAAFTNTREVGNLTVEKILESDVPADADTLFHFTVTLSDTTISGEYGDMTFKDGVAEFDLKGGESATAEGLPTTVTYGVAESEGANYTTEKTGDTGTITADEESEAVFTNTRKVGELTISKEVISDLAADADKEFEFTITLQDTPISKEYDATKGEEAIKVKFEEGVAKVTLKGGESITITGLPVDVDFTVAETADANFTTEKTGDVGTITEKASEVEFTNTRKVGDLTVSKTVKSDLEEDADVEFKFTVTLSDTTINGEYGDMTFKDGVAEFTLKDGDSATAEGLPVTVEYTVEEEENKAYTTEAEGDTGAIAEEASEAKFTNTRNMIEIKVTKVWEDEKDKYGIRPESVTADLYAGEEVYDSAELSEDNDLTHIFVVPQYTTDGEEIEWSVDEQPVIAGYAKDIDGDAKEGFVITNTFAPVWGDPPVQKFIDGDTPSIDETFKFKLTAVSFEKDKDSIEDLSGKMPMPEDAKGAQEMTIEIVGANVKEFGKFPLVVTGTYTYTITEEKGDAEGYTYSTETHTVVYVVSADTDNSLKIVKSVDGVEIEGEETDDANVSKFKITNEYDKPVVSVKVSKVWDDRDNEDGSRPTAVAVKLLANGKDSGKSIALNAANDWTYTFEELDKYDEKGVAIKYEVEETDVPKGYTVDIKGDMEKGFVITNTLEVKTGDTDDMRIWGSVMAVSMLCMIFLVLKKRKGGKHYSN